MSPFSLASLFLVCDVEPLSCILFVVSLSTLHNQILNETRGHVISRSGSTIRGGKICLVTSSLKPLSTTYYYPLANTPTNTMPLFTNRAPSPDPAYHRSSQHRRSGSDPRYSMYEESSNPRQQFARHRRSSSVDSIVSRQTTVRSSHLSHQPSRRSREIQAGNQGSISAAREAVYAAEALEKQASQALAVARQAVQEAYAHVKRLEREAEEE